MAEPKPSPLESAVQDFSGPLYSAALGLGFPPTDAEELVQDSFAGLAEALPRFEGRSSLKTYLFGILYNKARELWRRRKRELGLEDLEGSLDARLDARGHWLTGNGPRGPEEENLSKEVLELITLCAEKLSLNQKAAFQLIEVEGQTREEACNALGISDTNLRVLLHRARLGLRECLEKRWEARP